MKRITNIELERLEQAYAGEPDNDKARLVAEIRLQDQELDWWRNSVSALGIGWALACAHTGDDDHPYLFCAGEISELLDKHDAITARIPARDPEVITDGP